MKSYNPLSIIKELETGKLQSYPIGIAGGFWAIIIHFAFAALCGRILLNMSFHTQISTILSVLIINIAALACLLIVCRELFFTESEEGFYTNNRLTTKIYIYTIIIVIGLVVFNNVINVLMVRFFNISSYVGSMRGIIENNYGFAIMYICLIGPFVEELIYRSALLGSLLKKYNPTLSIIISTLLFSIIHVYILQMIAALTLGAVLGVLYYRYKSVILCFIVHALHNFTALFITSSDECLEMFGAQSIMVASLISLLGLIIILYIFKLLSNESEKVKDIEYI